MTGMANQAYDAIRALEYRYARLLDEETLDMDDAYNAAGVPVPRVAANEAPSIA